MLIRPRVMVLSAAFCVFAAIGAPSAALAHHRGREHFGRLVHHGKQVQRVCAEAGVSLNGRPRWKWDGHGLSSLNETQVNELKAACEKLAAAYAVKRQAEEAAGKTLWEALKPARAKLDEACPAVTEHPGFWWSHTELSPACEEALKSYWTSAREAKMSFRAAIEAACKPFRAALTEFESTTAPILSALEAAETAHFFAHGHGGPGSVQGYGDPGSGKGDSGPGSGERYGRRGSAQGDGDPGSQGSCRH